MQKVITILGTRPEIIRTSRITPKLDNLCDHIIVHTNQNFTNNLKDLFFQELELRQPDIALKTNVQGGWNEPSHTTRGLGQQLADMFPQIEQIFKETKPDKVFILGDTNSALCTIIAERMGIPVYHMEAGNRSYDVKIPEEVNRHLIDAISSYNLTYTQTSKEALLREGNNSKKIFLCGNPTAEVLNYYNNKIDNSNISKKLNLMMEFDFGHKDYFLADFHRTENVDNPEKLKNLIEGLNNVAQFHQTPVICSIHPRTQSKLNETNVVLNKNVKFLDAMGFFDFVNLEKHAQIIFTDSGLVSEEACILGTPCVIIRDTTERPEVVESGSAIISGVNSKNILSASFVMQKLKRKSWPLPKGYEDLNVSNKVINYILGEKQ